jgi:hypothetical protein
LAPGRPCASRNRRTAAAISPGFVIGPKWAEVREGHGLGLRNRLGQPARAMACRPVPSPLPFMTLLDACAL